MNWGQIIAETTQINKFPESLRQSTAPEGLFISALSKRVRTWNWFYWFSTIVPYLLPWWLSDPVSFS